MIYTYEQKMKAIELFIKYDLSPSAVIHELGYPSRNQIRAWYKEYAETGTVKEKSARNRSKFTAEQRATAVKYYLEHGRSITKTIRALGYPKRTTLCEWLNEDLEDKQRKNYNKRIGVFVKITPEQRETAVKEHLSGEKTPSQLARELSVTPSTIHHWSKKLLDTPTQKISSELSDNVPELYSEIKKLKGEAEALRKQVFRLQLERDILEKAAEIIKKDQGINLENLTNQEKTELIDALRNKYRLKILLEALHISKSSYCYQVNVIQQGDKYAELRQLIKDIFTASRNTYGYRRIYMELRTKGKIVSEKVIKRLMREASLTVKLPKLRKYNAYKGEITPAVENIVNRDFHADAPNTKWLSDITEFQIRAGKIYLSSMIDCFDGAIVSWTIGTSPNAELVNDMLDMAIRTLKKGERPIVHTDRGAHYRWPGWIYRMEKAGLIRSMSKKGCSPDNSACEGFFGRLKNEMFYNRDWNDVSIDEFIEILDRYIHWYNEARIKVSLGGKSPLQYRQSLGIAV